ncbi:(2Fe-2S) ferredoxin domain-containing protein [Lujinxingia vulgaris]|uniref:(2Fe-2S) ferredoxin domain-containing protein n=1 Tax=Lujinxingia vulgaris TaxID=2600176 RepID=A0A5C6WV28_9DELT|nr:(2Fe-2S) ferredoxin domain-containing protein [Lujinxingia vulgaris]TXD31416.1 (2Fe-2S) ferredoxin domain-containing protein [Lujinxingia vulgaris]
MKPVDTSFCLAHLLVCVNQRHNSALPCCASGDAEAIYQKLRAWIEAHDMLSRIWITRTECLGWCHVNGGTVAIYPQNIWVRAMTLEDCDALIEEHLQPLLSRTSPRER